MKNFRIAPERNAERLGNCFAGEVVFRGAKTAAEDQDVRAKQRVLRGSDEAPEIVTDNRFSDDINPKLVELAGEVKRVGVHAVRSQHF